MLGEKVTSEFANSPREVHALVHGFYVGLHRDPRRPEVKDSRREKHYWRAGYLFGTVVYFLLLVYLARKVYNLGRDKT